jgi:hypothetical protein
LKSAEVVLVIVTGRLVHEVLVVEIKVGWVSCVGEGAP